MPRNRLAGPEILREPVHARRHAGIGHWRYLLLIGWSVALLGAGLDSYAPAADADFMFMAAFPGPGHLLGLVLFAAFGQWQADPGRRPGRRLVRGTRGPRSLARRAGLR
ncbi:MAG TPA: hypothetical protein VHO07_22815 [Streptosporangiaceae bacterium]|nr:hypothetical protein [Streptosporangiaceae bacterium]